ncbi:hypothetical protein [Salinicoccus carnicancri]|uniref:hypothetical protein n=1 Tax=Salinicoccus carnicancri TaxID=558170 RepID=UPI00031E6191|nr:hypothetical protein [Salinicoccus carnicancri]
MDLFVQLLIGIVPAIISGFVAYIKATKEADIELGKAQKEIERVEKESEGRIKEIEKRREKDLEFYKGKLEADNEQNQNEFVNQYADQFMGKLFGDIDNIEDLMKMSKKFGYDKEKK